jgi:ATP-dependent DNA helicase RecQ
MKFLFAALLQIAVARPGSLAGLSGISGVGESKLAKYGPGVLEAISSGQSTGGAAAAPAAVPGTGRGESADDDPEWPDEPPDLFG